MQAGRIVERKRGLREDRREHRGLEHHREREVAGEAHPDGPDAGTAALLMRQSRERPEPSGDRARLVCRKGAELGTDACALEDGRPLLGAWHRAISAKKRRHVDRETRIPHPAAEARDVGADARHFRHDNHGGTGSVDVHLLGHRIEGDRARSEILQLVILVHVSIRHG
ncbi:hypothetical protein D3C86_1482430 [compost metagenome]